ncbi:MAG: porin [Pseudobdellovibrionaceae bacterium]
MNKLMLGAAAAALLVSPALAADDSGVKLGLGGHFKGYVNYTNEDNVRSIDILRQTEVHFGGETTLDNGLTVGAHIEADADAGEGFDVDESYVYFAGGWGRVNFGQEDGAAYLLQVAAPSADDNIDGIRQFINPNATISSIDYANDFAQAKDKLTYLSPVFSGFQAGLSYTPDNDTVGRALAGNSEDTTAGEQSDIWELAARYEGQVSNVGVIAGAGYTTASQEEELAGTDDFAEWNVGLDLDIGAFGIGAIYTENNNSNDTDDENETYVVGADYSVGPYKVGASYLNNQENVGTDSETDRYTAGVVYTYGPGMTFRGSVAYTEQDLATGTDPDATTVTLGTQVNF